MDVEHNGLTTSGGAAGIQTMMRGLDVIEAVSDGTGTLNELAERLGLTRSTTHRLAASLGERGYLAFAPREGYRLGSKLLALGHLAHAQTDLIQTVRPHLEALSDQTGDAVHCGVLDNGQALYLDKMPGRRRITISSRVGDRQPLSSTGLGKALMRDHHPDYWRERFAADRNGADPVIWEGRMHDYAAAGCAFDLEENEDQIRCVAPPVRDAAGRVVGAISVSSAAQYMSDDRMNALSPIVAQTAFAIGHDLGWSQGE
ncbi:IclR family transcriptional regulator [Sphingomonas sp. PAMC 26605]|uniref:IclR family transcriptional regulator n=1 Tax=Sphingomonas sp. PAMC 26605 TaxID=1112214 RepID=UPI00026CABA2|nr:IclR family transcriptional regulator [Sphingomonas sp. PAMC 26605]